MQGNVHEKRKGPVSEVSSRGRRDADGLPVRALGSPR